MSAKNIPPSDLPYDMLDTPLSSGGYPPCSLLHLQRTEGTFAAIISTNESHTPMDIGDKVNSSILNYRMICDTVGVRFLKGLCSGSTRHGTRHEPSKRYFVYYQPVSAMAIIVATLQPGNDVSSVFSVLSHQGWTLSVPRQFTYNLKPEPSEI